MAAPTPTLTEFLIRYPEFDGAQVQFPGSLEAILSEAASETSDWAFPSVDSQKAYTMISAAILAYNAPFSRELRLDMTSAPKVKDLERLRYMKAVVATMGLRTFVQLLAFAPAMGVALKLWL
jgi:hypothetical protein